MCGIVRIGFPVVWKGDSSGQRWVDKVKMMEDDCSRSSDPEELMALGIAATAGARLSVPDKAISTLFWYY